MGRTPILIMSAVMMSMLGLVLLLAVGPQSVQGRTVNSQNYVCTIRDSDDELVSCTGSGSSLSLYNTAISSIRTGHFPVVFYGLSRLSQLDLHNNAISSIRRGMFDGLSRLSQLHLGNNAISSIQAGAFDGLSAVYELYLNNNAISRLPAGWSNGLSALTTLYLYNNAISRYQLSGFFNGLPGLTRLWLENNPFTSVRCDWGVNTTVTTDIQLPAGVSLPDCVTPAPTNAPTRSRPRPRPRTTPAPCQVTSGCTGGSATQCSALAACNGVNPAVTGVSEACLAAVILTGVTDAIAACQATEAQGGSFEASEVPPACQAALITVLQTGCNGAIEASGSSGDDSGASVGMIIGIIAGVLVVCGVGGGLVAFFVMRQNSDDNQKGAGSGALAYPSSITNTPARAVQNPVYGGAAVEGEGYLHVGANVAVGDRVSVEGKGGGVVQFVGPHAENGKPRVGVELDDAVGKNNGTVKGHKYFTCKDNHGSLVAPGKVTAEDDTE